MNDIVVAQAIFCGQVDFLKVQHANLQKLLEMCHLRYRLRTFLFRRKAMFR